MSDICTGKTVNGVAHTYLLEGATILQESWGSNKLFPMYDTMGEVCGIIHNSARYYFRKNLQGDVIAIVDSNLTTVAEYTYDAWGKVLSVTDANGNDIDDTTHIAHINPFRYRSYYYDTETGLYVVGQRYYDPILGRFIQSANISNLNKSSINGLNLYSYENNNPFRTPFTVKSTNISSLNISSLANILPILNVSPSVVRNGNNNYWNIHDNHKWFDTGRPSFLILSNDGFKVINWGLSIYKGSLYFDNNEQHSLYASLGNIGIYAGVNYKEGIGIDAGASVLEIGYDGRIIDASIEGLTIGITYMYKDGKFEFGYGAGWFGWSVSIDFVELWRLIFGGE